VESIAAKQPYPRAGIPHDQAKGAAVSGWLRLRRIRNRDYPVDGAARPQRLKRVCGAR